MLFVYFYQINCILVIPWLLSCTHSYKHSCRAFSAINFDASSYVSDILHLHCYFHFIYTCILTPKIQTCETPRHIQIQTCLTFSGWGNLSSSNTLIPWRIEINHWWWQGGCPRLFYFMGPIKCSIMINNLNNFLRIIIPTFLLHVCESMCTSCMRCVCCTSYV